MCSVSNDDLLGCLLKSLTNEILIDVEFNGFDVDNDETGEINLGICEDDIGEFLKVVGWRFNLKDFDDVDEIWSNNEVSDLVEGVVDFDKEKSSSSSQTWLNKSDNTGNTR